jgi:hypothetical protein
MSYNSWLYAYGSPVNLTDPTGHYACNEFDKYGRCVDREPFRLPDSVANITWISNLPCGCSVWNLSQWQTIEDLPYDKWLIALHTYSNYCNLDSSTGNVFWSGESQLSLRLVLAHNIVKEFGDMIIYPEYENIKEAQTEAYARQYWEHCGSGGCYVKNGVSSSRLISFLSASDSWRMSATGIDDILLNGFGPRRKQAALALADRILRSDGSDSIWRGGYELDSPYHYGYITDQKQKPPTSPRWLIRFLNSGNIGTGNHQYVASHRSGDKILFVLTPNQSRALCQGTICVRLLPTAKKPDWLP